MTEWNIISSCIKYVCHILNEWGISWNFSNECSGNIQKQCGYKQINKKITFYKSIVSKQIFWNYLKIMLRYLLTDIVSLKVFSFSLILNVSIKLFSGTTNCYQKLQVSILNGIHCVLGKWIFGNWGDFSFGTCMVK